MHEVCMSASQRFRDVFLHAFVDFELHAFVDFGLSSAVYVCVCVFRV